MPISSKGSIRSLVFVLVVGLGSLVFLAGPTTAQDDSDYLWEGETYLGKGHVSGRKFSGSVKGGGGLYYDDARTNVGVFTRASVDFEKNDRLPVYSGEAHFTAGIVLFKAYNRLASFDGEFGVVGIVPTWGATLRIEGMDTMRYGTHNLRWSDKYILYDEPFDFTIGSIPFEAFVTIGIEANLKLSPSISAEPFGLDLKAEVGFAPFIESGTGPSVLGWTAGLVVKGTVCHPKVVLDYRMYEQQPLQVVLYAGVDGAKIEAKAEAWRYQLGTCGKGREKRCTLLDRITETTWSYLKGFFGRLTRRKSTRTYTVAKAGKADQYRNVLGSLKFFGHEFDPIIRFYFLKWDPWRNYAGDDETARCITAIRRDPLTPTPKWTVVGTREFSLVPPFQRTFDAHGYRFKIRDTGRHYKIEIFRNGKKLKTVQLRRDFSYWRRRYSVYGAEIQLGDTKLNFLPHDVRTAKKSRWKWEVDLFLLTVEKLEKRLTASGTK